MVSMPTIKDVAKKANVSIATVSYVLNNKANSVSTETRQLVLQAAKEIGYTPNVTARNLKFNRTRLIGYAWHEAPHNQNNPVMDQFTYSLAHAAEEELYHLLTFTHHPQNPAPIYENLINMGRIDAFVLAGTKQDDPRIEILLERNFPFACFGRSNSDQQFPWVDVDGTLGIQLATEHLIELGHRHIMMVTWDDNATTTYDRIQGYVKTMHKYQLPIHEYSIFRGNYGLQLGIEAFHNWMELSPSEQPTAIVAISDLEAVGVMNAAQKLGKVVGIDLSVVGFDDLPMSSYLRPALTTIQQPIQKVATELVQLLQKILQNPNAQPENKLLTPTLIKRDSTAPLCSS